ncbi:hypothetical protein DYB34_013094, partial [Aphanomyces astaci]
MFSPQGRLVNHVVDGGVSILPVQTRISEAPSATTVNFAPVAGLVFTPENWNLPQEVTVTAVDDSIAEDTHYASITHAVVSSDPHFAPSTPFMLGKSVAFTVTDNDRPSVFLSRSNVYAVEGGATDRYGVVLTTRPWYNVTVTAVAMRPLQTQLTPSQVMFTPQNWNVVQYIVVHAVDDNVSENEF